MIRPASDIVCLAPSTHRVYRRRFYVLLVFSFLTFNQCLFWLTFSPISKSTQSYYRISEATVNLLLNWGAIIFIPSLPLAYFLLNKRNGLRRTVIIVAITGLVAALLRAIPSLATSPSNPRFMTIALPFLHVGQILNAACGPLTMVPVSQLSCMWFGSDERTRATTLAITTHSFGATIGFLISPSIVNAPEFVPRLLYIHLGLAVAACVLTLAYFPAQPPTAPSAAAELLINQPTNDESVWTSLRTFVKNLRQCFTTPSLILLVLMGSLVAGTFSAWTSLFANILGPENFTERQAGWFGFGASLAGIVSALLTSVLADTRFFRRSFKMMMLTTLVCCLLSVVWFVLSVRTLLYDTPILTPSVATVAVSLTLAGLFQGSSSPLVYEAMAEIMFPLPESLSASILLELSNVISLIFVFVAPNRYKLMNLLVVLVIAVSIALLAFVRVTYNRRDAEERKRSGLEVNSEQPVRNGTDVLSTNETLS